MAFAFILLKLQFDFSTYQTMTEVMPTSDGDISPSIIAGGIKVMILYSIPVLTSLILSIVGFRNKNNYRKIALSLNILTIVYLVIPTGILLAVY